MIFESTKPLNLKDLHLKHGQLCYFIDDNNTESLVFYETSTGIMYFLIEKREK